MVFKDRNDDKMLFFIPQQKKRVQQSRGGMPLQEKRDG
jgi:hypothetical protein